MALIKSIKFDRFMSVISGFNSQKWTLLEERPVSRMRWFSWLRYQPVLLVRFELISCCRIVLLCWKPSRYEFNSSQTSRIFLGHPPELFHWADALCLTEICISNFAPFVDRSVFSWWYARIELQFRHLLLAFPGKIVRAELKCFVLWLSKRQGFLRRGWHAGCYHEVADIEG